MNVYKLIEKIYYDLDFSRKSFNFGLPNCFNIFEKDGKTIIFKYNIKDLSENLEIHLPEKTYVIKNQDVSKGDYIEILNYAVKREI